MRRTKLIVFWVIFLIISIQLFSVSKRYILNFNKGYFLDESGFDPNNTNPDYFYAPKNAIFIILGTETFEESTYLKVGFDSIPQSIAQDESVIEVKTFNGFVRIGNSMRIVELSKKYLIKAHGGNRLIENEDYSFLQGTVYGILAVPYKLQLSKKFPITSGSSIGPYIGFKQKKTTYIFSAGLTLIPIQDINETKIETRLGLTGAAGIVFDMGPQFQMGLIVGMDHIGGEPGDLYEFNHHFWASFGIGVVFIN